MKYTVLPFVLAGVALAQQVAASPIRVVVVTTHQEMSSNVRFGHPTAESNIPSIAQVMRPTFVPDESMNRKVGHQAKHGCMGRKMREKAMEWSNTLRKAFGFPEMEVHKHHHVHEHAPPPPGDDHPEWELKAIPIVHAGEDAHKDDLSGEIHILPFIGTPGDGGPELTPVHQNPKPKVHGHMRHRVCGSFLKRLNFAITALGPWEGRAVAFVLGCGIGVLLRMIWVMGIVMYRFMRGNKGRDSENEIVYDVVVFDRDAESIVLPPPEYTDEKVALVAADQGVKL